MKCPTCKKDFEKAVKAAYELGLMDNRYKPTEKQLRAYSLVVCQGYTHRAAGKILGICHNAVTQRILRIKSKIK